MHDHTECSHSLKYCPKCDVVYCTICSREWYEHKHNWYTNVYPYTITYGQSDNMVIDRTVTVSDCVHS